MREKTLKYLVTFHTTTQAMSMEKACVEGGLGGRLIPVPRQISAGCGMAWCAPLEGRAAIRRMLESENMEYDEEYEVLI